MKNKAVFKFNGGNPVILCSKCSVIIKYSKDFTEEESKACKGEAHLPEKYCDKCKELEPTLRKCYCGHTTYCDCGPLGEPKQETLNLDKLESQLDDALEKETKESLTNWLHSKRNNQQTIEEVAEKQWGNVHRTGVLGFIEGAKYQQERMYSEAIKFGKWLDENMQQREYYPMSAMTMEELFEQFKKK